MSSWGDNHISWNNIKWIANYPYNVKEDKYTKGHEWQWTDKQQFKDSYGGFDASQFITITILAVKIRMLLFLMEIQQTFLMLMETTIINPSQDKNMTATSGNNSQYQNEDYAQNEMFTANTTLNIRTAPSTSTKIIDSYAPGI